MYRVLNRISIQWYLTMIFLAMTITSGQAMEPDSVWMKQFNNYVYRKAKSSIADTTIYYNWKGFYLARKHNNDSLQLLCMENMLNIPNSDSIKHYLAVVDTFPDTYYRFTIKNQLQLSYYRYKTHELKDDEAQDFLKELITNVNDAFADSIFPENSSRDSIQYLLNNWMYLSSLVTTVNVQSTDSPFYPYLIRYNKVLDALPESYAHRKINAQVLTSSLYLGMGDYARTMKSSEQVVQYILKVYGYPTSFEKMDITYASILYYMYYQQLQCYDIIKPEIRQRNWAFITSDKAKEVKQYLSTFDGHYFYADMFYAMCIKDYEKAIDICETNILAAKGNSHAQLTCIEVQNVALKRVKNLKRYTYHIKRNYEIVKKYNMENTDDNHKDYATLHKVNQLEQRISQSRLYKEKLRIYRSWGLLFGGTIVLALLIWRWFTIVDSSKKKSRIMTKVEEELELTKQKTLEAQEASQMQSLYLNNMNHEVRSPLNAVVGFSKLLLDDDELDQETKKTYSKYIRTSSDLLLQIVNDVLDTAQLQSGNYTLDKKNHLVHELCEEATQSVQGRVSEGVQLILDCEVEQAVTACTDKNRLLQILLNLLSNACKHTVKGTIILSCQWYNQEHTLLRFAVTDTGSGVPEEKVSNLFQRFEKLDENTQGTGLGLNICATLAKLLGGQVGYDKDYHNGARFYLDLPVSL